MKTYIICCVPAQIPYLGKFLFLRYGPKCSQPYLESKSMKWPDFLHVHTNSHKLKVDQKLFELAWSKMGMASLVVGL